MHENSELLFQEHALPLFQPGMRVLEIGPDAFPSGYQRLTNSLSLEWDTLDMYDSAQLTYPNSSEYSFAIPDESYDVVLSGQANNQKALDLGTMADGAYFLTVQSKGTVQTVKVIKK